MSTKNVTVTSKNQITLPIDFVRSLRLSRTRMLRAELHAGTITLTPQPGLKDTMRRFWGKHHAVRPLTDTEITQAVREHSAARNVGRSR